MADQFTKHLAEKGYTAIAFPSNEFRLLTLEFEDHGARGHANSFDSLAPGIHATLAAPEVNSDLPTIAGERTRNVDLGVGLKILSGLISALGAGSIGLDAGFKAARKLTFAYDGISSETLDPVALQIALGAVPVPTTGLLRDFLDDHLYVVTSVLRATKIAVTGHDESGLKIGLDVPAISQAAEGKLKADFSGTNDSTVTFDNQDAPVPFAVTLFQVVPTRDKPRMLTLRTAKEGTVTIKAVAGGDLALDGMPHLDTLDQSADEDAPSAIVLPWDPERQLRDALTPEA